ncbi:MAG: hypothetical protein MZV70_49055 [Desulfobacterales bacterium]|nr:hypothetical protein [Desulfobacterales bacterium]
MIAGNPAHLPETARPSSPPGPFATAACGKTIQGAEVFIDGRPAGAAPRRVPGGHARAAGASKSAANDTSRPLRRWTWKAVTGCRS